MRRELSHEAILSFVDEVTATVVELRELFTQFSSEENEELMLALNSRIQLEMQSVQGMASFAGFLELSLLYNYLEQVFQTLSDNHSLPDSTCTDLFHDTTLATTIWLEAVRAGDLSHQDLEPFASLLVACRRQLELPIEDDEEEVQRLFAALNSEDVEEADELLVENETEEPDSSAESAQLHEFQEEAAAHLQLMDTLLTEFVLDEENPVELLEQVRQHVHSLKGSAAVMGLEKIASHCHQMEELLEQTLSTEFQESQDLNTEETDRIESLLACNQTLQELIFGRSSAAQLTALSATLEERQSLIGESDFIPEQNLPSDLHESQNTDEVEYLTESFPEITIAERNQIPAELLEVFVEEAEDHLKRMYAALADLEEQVGDPQSLNELRRAAHTLKGAAGAVGMQAITQFSHRMEDLLDALDEGHLEYTPETGPLLLGTCDVLQDLVSGDFERTALQTTIQRLAVEYHRLLKTIEDEEREVEPETTGHESSAITTATETTSNITEKKSSSLRELKPGSVLRVPLDRVDALVRLVSELIINRTGFEQQMGTLVRFSKELQATTERLKEISLTLDADYGVNFLGTQLQRELAHVEQTTEAARAFFPSNSRSDEFDELEFDQYTEFHLLSRSLSESTHDLNTIGNGLGTLIGDVDSLLSRQHRLSRDLQNRLMRVRMVPLSTITTRLHRTVRVITTQQEKMIDLQIVGESVELDKVVLEQMTDPLLHLLRNAADHGIESPALRKAQGKPELATVTVKAYHQGTQVILQVSDDGAGLKTHLIRETAVREGYCSTTEVLQMSDAEIHQLIFNPSFSTAPTVSEISGRGMGMDIVRTQVNQLNGTISVDSVENEGTTFTIRLPLTLSLMRALMIQEGDATYAFPMQSLKQITRINSSQIQHVAQAPVLQLDGETYAYYSLANCLQLSEAIDTRNQTESDGHTIPVLILHVGDREIAVGVERILSGRDIVVKTLGSHLRRVRGMIGATLLGDGSVVPILNPAELIGNRLTPGKVPSAERFGHSKPPSTETISPTTVMIVDDSVSVRRVLSNLIRSVGWVPILAKDGLDALETLDQNPQKPDLFLLDIEMPRMDGYELLSQVRSQKEFAETPIVMLTSRAREKHREKALALGASAYLSKPYQDEELLNCLRELLKVSRSSPGSSLHQSDGGTT